MEIIVNYLDDFNTKCIIYKITFPNGKFYIGQTINTLNVRIKQHVSGAKRGVQTVLYSAIRKYQTLDVSILKVCETIEELNHYEEFYIKDLDCTISSKKGYNTRLGGKNTKPSEETLIKIRAGLERTKIERGIKISKALKGRKRTAEVQEKINKKRKETNLKNKYLYGKKYTHTATEASKEKLKTTLMNKPNKECPFCKLIGRGSNMTRYHFDNCKLKIL